MKKWHLVSRVGLILPLLCGVLYFSAEAQAAGDLRRVYSLINQLERTLHDNQHQYDSAEIRHFENVLSETIRRATNPSGTGQDQVRCINTAVDGPFTSSEAMSLCSSGGNENTALCALRAYRGPFTTTEAIQLCAGQQDVLPAECALNAHAGPFTTSEAIILCRRYPTQETAMCAVQAHRGPFTTSESVDLCRDGGNLSNLSCAMEAVRNLSTSEAVRLCRSSRW